MKKFNRIVFIFISIFMLGTVLYLGYIENMKKDIADNLLRLHIVGADDSEYSQNLKICVRDRILSDFSEVFSYCGSLEASAARARELKPRIEAAAADELKSRGCNDSVSAVVEECRFPTKNYGEVTLPGGVYTALNIRLGAARGHNWWCVMYPPLCFKEGEEVRLSKESEKILREKLDKDTYDIITKNDKEVVVKFKLVEIVQEIKQKINGD